MAKHTREKHLWKFRVRHRDYIATMNDDRKRLIMAETQLFIVISIWDHDHRRIEQATAKLQRFLKSHQRIYGIPTILGCEWDGTIDA